MAQPYTARQLDFFKFTLKILESAVSGTELPIAEALPVQAALVVSATPAVQVVQERKEAVDRLGDALTASSVESFVTPTVTAPPTRQLEAFTVAMPQAKTSTVFFQDLPWQQEPPVAPKTEVITYTGSKAVKTTATFFQALPWSQSAPVSSTSAPTQRTEAFFKSLPWQGQPQQSPDFITAMSNDDFSTIANIATQTAIQAAQRGLNSNAVVSKEAASHFFHALPW